MGFRKKSRGGVGAGRNVEKDIREVFLGEGAVPLTDEVVKMLVEEKGWPEDDLRDAQEMGAKYHPGRESLIM